MNSDDADDDCDELTLCMASVAVTVSLYSSWLRTLRSLILCYNNNNIIIIVILEIQIEIQI